MDALDSVKSWMRFFGWTNDGGPGGEKLSDTKAVIARHGDAVWIADVEQAIERSERAKLVAELERRESLRRGSSHGYGEQPDR